MEKRLLPHWNYILKYIKSSNKIKLEFISEQKNKENVSIFELWIEITDLFEFINNDIFGDVNKAILMFQFIPKKYSKIL